MSSSKRVIGNDGNLAPYDIFANVVTIHGNLQIMGNTSTLDITNSVITDNILTLNHGTTTPNPAGAAIEVDRGTSPNVQIRWSEANTRWELSNDGSTYSAIAAITGTTSASGPQGAIQWANAGYAYGSSNLTINSGNLRIANTSIGNGNIWTTGTNQDLYLQANGSGYVVINDVAKLAYQSTAPTNQNNYTMLFANTVGSGGTGLYVVNSGTGDELITKTKATVLALIFG
jgi:hypothetical protein